MHHGSSSPLLRRITAAVAVVAGLTLGPVGTAAANDTLKTARPDLVSATALNATDMRICFDVALGTTFNFTNANFYLQGYAAARKSTNFLSLGNAPAIDPTSANCALAHFVGTGDVRTFTLAVVDAGAVIDTLGNLNVRNSVPITGSSVPSPPGASSLPDLIGLDRNADNTITYTFDEPLTRADPERFGFYTTGQATDPNSPYHGGTNLVGFNSGDDKVKVAFAGLGTLVQQAVRFTARRGAVSGQQLDENVATGIGLDTVKPELTSTSGRLGYPAIYAFDFDQNVRVANLSRFIAVDASGNTFSSTNVALSASNPRRVNVTFTAASSPVADYNQITQLVVEAGAVTAATGDGLPNTEGLVAVSPVADRTGLTDAPDLVAFNANATTGLVTYFFDEPLRTFNQAAFIVYDQNGTFTGPVAGTVGLAGGNAVQIQFGTAAATAVGTSIADGAVTDADGLGSPVGALGTTAPSTPPTTTPPPTTPTTVTATSVVTKSIKRTKSRKTGKVVKITITGRVTSSNSACRGDRTITVSGARTGGSFRRVRTVSTTSSGRYTVTLTGTNARLTRFRVAVSRAEVELPSSTVVCSATTA
jgi:hypothetical protein